MPRAGPTTAPPAPCSWPASRSREGWSARRPTWPNLDDGGDPRFTTDFRDVYATLLRRWLAVDPEPILGKRDETLSVF